MKVTHTLVDNFNVNQLKWYQQVESENWSLQALNWAYRAKRGKEHTEKVREKEYEMK